MGLTQQPYKAAAVHDPDPIGSGAGEGLADPIDAQGRPNLESAAIKFVGQSDRDGDGLTHRFVRQIGAVAMCVQFTIAGSQSIREFRLHRGHPVQTDDDVVDAGRRSGRPTIVEDNKALDLELLDRASRQRLTLQAGRPTHATLRQRDDPDKDREYPENGELPDERNRQGWGNDGQYDNRRASCDE